MKIKSILFGIVATLISVATVSSCGSKQQTELDKFNEQAEKIGEDMSLNRGNTIAEKKYYDEIFKLYNEAKSVLNEEDMVKFTRQLCKATADGHDWSEREYERKIQNLNLNNPELQDFTMMLLKEECNYKFGNK